MAKKYGGRLVFADRDEFGEVEVVDFRAFRGLHFGNGCKQSEILRDSPYFLTLEYMQHMMAALAFYPSFSRVLVLGVGGGNIPHFLHHFFPAARIDVCDLRPLVFKVASEFFFFPSTPKIRNYVNDAEAFMGRANQAYDLIFVDLFNESGLSKLVSSKKFLANVLNSLSRSGGAIYNFWSSHGAPYAHCGNLLDNRDMVSLRLPTPKGNVIYLILPRDRRNYPANVFRRNPHALSREMGIPFREILSRLLGENETFFLGRRGGKHA